MRLQTEMIVYSVFEALFASKVTLSRLNRHMSKQELDLFKLTSSLMAKPSAGSTEVMWGDDPYPTR
jgi:hypothetical protein